MHFFLLLFVKMYCIFYVLLVRKINFFCFPFTNVLCSIFGSGEGSAQPWGTGPAGAGGGRKKRRRWARITGAAAAAWLPQPPAPCYLFPSVLAALPWFLGPGCFLPPLKARPGGALVPLTVSLQHWTHFSCPARRVSTAETHLSCGMGSLAGFLRGKGKEREICLIPGGRSRTEICNSPPSLFSDTPGWV